MYRSSDFIHEFFRELFWNRCVMLRNRSGTSPELLPNSFHGKHLHVYVKKKNNWKMIWIYQRWNESNGKRWIALTFWHQNCWKRPYQNVESYESVMLAIMHNRCCMSFYNVLPSLKRKTKLMKGKFLGWHFKNIMAYSMLKVIHLRSPN